MPAGGYYVGDFDPSGWQMARNLQEKLVEFDAPVRFERLAVNPEQIQAWELPTRPSKGIGYAVQGVLRRVRLTVPSRLSSDAIHPDLLRGLVRDAIERHIDHGSGRSRVTARR
jgi:hypothetical protein